MNLTTLTRYKTFMGLSGTGQDAVITAVIPLVSDLIAKYLRHTMETATYQNWLDGSGSNFLRFEQWPITALYLVSVTSKDVGYIENTSSSVTRASVSFDGTNLRLSEISTAGVATHTTAAVSTYKILSEMKTKVDGTSGWSLTLNSSEYENEPSAWLRWIYGSPASNPDTASLYLPDNPIAVKLVDDDTIETLDGFTFPSGRANIFAWYVAGYTLPTDDTDGTLPPGLEMLVFEIIKDAISNRKFSSAVRSENIGDYGYSLGAEERGAVASSVQNRKKDLNLFRKVTL